MQKNQSLLDRIASSIGYVKKEAPQPAPEWYTASAAVNMYGGIPDPSIYGNQADFYRKLSWVNIAVNLVSYAAASVDYQVKKYVGDKPNPVINHPFERLLRRPNPEQDRFDYFQSIFAYLLLTGNSYIYKVQENETTPPIELWVIPTPNIKPVLSEKLGISHYEYDAGLSKIIKIPKYRIDHLKTFNPNNLFVGLSPVESIGMVAHGDLKMQEWNTNFFAKQNAKIPGALAFKDNIDDAAFNKVKREVQEQWGGTSRFGPMLLRNVGVGVNWIEMGMSQADMEFIGGRNMNRDEIFSVYAPGLLSMISPDSTEASARIGKATFTEYTLYPYLKMVDEKFTNNILPLYGDDLVFEHEDPRVTDNLLRLRQMREYATTHTINETREKYWDDKPLPDEKGNQFASEISSFNSGGDFQFRDRQGGEDTDIRGDATSQEEMKAWRNFEVRHFGKKTKRDFVCEYISIPAENRIRGELRQCNSVDEIKDVFNREIDK